MYTCFVPVPPYLHLPLGVQPEAIPILDFYKMMQIAMVHLIVACQNALAKNIRYYFSIFSLSL